MKKRIILTGKAGSGKDYARKLLQKHCGLKYAVSFTTRPPRLGEIQGEDYFFITPEEFESMIAQNFWYEYAIFNGWYYGTTKEQFYSTADVFIMTPSGLAQVSTQDRKDSFVIYFDIPEEIRRKRIEARQGNVDSVERRLRADENDFRDFKDFDVKIVDPEYTLTHLIQVLS